MASRKTWKDAVSSDPGYASWTFGGAPRDVNKDPSARVSAALKAIHGRADRRLKAKVFAKRMWAAYYRVRDVGCRPASGVDPVIPGPIIDALCFGAGAGHRRVMMERYKRAARTAERFCRSL